MKSGFSEIKVPSLASSDTFVRCKYSICPSLGKSSCQPAFTESFPSGSLFFPTTHLHLWHSRQQGKKMGLPLTTSTHCLTPDCLLPRLATSELLVQGALADSFLWKAKRLTVSKALRPYRSPGSGEASDQALTWQWGTRGRSL